MGSQAYRNEPMRTECMPGLQARHLGHVHAGTGGPHGVPGLGQKARRTIRLVLSATSKGGGAQLDRFR